MRNRNRRWLLAWTFASLFPHIMLYNINKENEHKSNSTKEVRGIFAPRMDYEQWTPLGRGDPLKNDPTYDYVPPVLDRVHYWIDPASRKPDPPIPGESQKTEILVLGVSSKKPSTGTSAVADSRRDTYDPFLKFVEGPKFGVQNNYQRMSRPHYSASSSYYPFYTGKNKQPDFISNKSDQRIPYTVLMPPPIPGKKPLGSDVVNFQQALNSVATTERTSVTKTAAAGTTKSAALTRDTSSFTIQQANLLYHSSTLGNQDEFRQQNQHFGTVGASSSQVTWRTPLVNPPEPTMEFAKVHQVQRPQLKEHHPSLQRLPASPQNRNESQVMHKGQVTDGDLDISNIYVNIGKPEAQMHSPNDMEISSVSIEPPHIPVRQPPVLIRPSTSPNLMINAMQTNSLLMDSNRNSAAAPAAAAISMPQIPPMTLQTLQTMQTMKASPIIESSPPSGFTKKHTNSLHSLLQKEVTSATSKLIPTPSSASRPFSLPPTSEITQEITMTSTNSPPTMTTTTSLTTDPLFKHYKQPTEPLKGPMYLIIQGHSKVKTYGPGKQIHGISVQESNEIPTFDEKDVYAAVKHLHGYKKENNNEGRLRQGRANRLQTLSHVIKAGLGAIEFSENIANRRKDDDHDDDDVQEAELVVKYDVAAQTDSTSEVYYKGIVEAGDMARNMKNSSSGSSILAT